MVGADIAPPGSRGAIKLGKYVERTWELAAPSLRASLSAGSGPVLLRSVVV